MYRKIILSWAALPWTSCCSGALPRKEQQNCSFPCGQAPTLSFSKADPPSQILVPSFWLQWAGSSVSGCLYQCVTLAQWCSSELSPLPCVALIYHTVSVRVRDTSSRRGNGKLCSTCGPALMGDVKSGTTAGPSCLCLASSTLLQLPAVILVLFVHLPTRCSLPALSSFLGVFASPLLSTKIPVWLSVLFLTCPAFCGSLLC